MVHDFSIASNRARYMAEKLIDAAASGIVMISDYGQVDLPAILKEIECRVVKKLLEAEHGCVSRMSQRLRMHRSTISERLKLIRGGQ